jgi:MoxR-like ATPase
LEIKFKAKKEELEKLESENETEARAVRLLRYKRELSEPGHISVTESVEKDIASVLTSIEMGKFFILHGPTGTGKTSIAVKASFMATGQDPFVIACGPQLRESNLWGKIGLVAEERQIDATGKMDMATFTEFIHGPLTEAIKEGRGIIFDEFNLLESAQQNMIKAIANKQEGDYIDIPGDGRVKKHPNFHIGAAVNLAGEKHKREEISSETLREFRPEKIDYAEVTEAYDVFLARSLDELDQINLSHFDLTSTIPELMKVFVEIQKAYKGKLDMAGLQQLGISQATSMNAKSLGQLNTFVLGHWNLKTILQRYFGARNSIDKKSLIEIIDEELLKLLEINEKDKNLAARILLKSGFLNTLSEKQKEDLGIANPGIPFETETQINTKIEKSKNTKVWNIREIAELDPFNLRTRKTDEDLVSLDAEIKGEIPKNNLNTTEQIINNKKTLAQIQAENATWRAGVSWAKDYSPTAPIHRIDINSINYSDSTLLTVDQSKAGEITHIDQETPANLDHFFENTKPETIDPNTNPAFADLFKDANGNKRIPKRHEVFQRVISLYKDKYYIPGIDYMNWLMQNPGHSNAQALKNSRWNFFPSSVFRSDSGSSFVPCLVWRSSKWFPDGGWLDNVWNSSESIALLLR